MLSIGSSNCEILVLAQKNVCFLGLGSNLPYGNLSPAETVRAAIEALSDAGVSEIKTSPFYGTSPVPKSDQPDFVNCVVTGQTSLKAAALLHACQRIEMSFGRKRDDRWGARTLDVDILSYNNDVVPARADWQAIASRAAEGAVIPDLVLPHPQLHRRAFVLVPLCDLVPGWAHPVFGSCADDLLKVLPKSERLGVWAFSGD